MGSGRRGTLMGSGRGNPNKIREGGGEPPMGSGREWDPNGIRVREGGPNGIRVREGGGGGGPNGIRERAHRGYGYHIKGKRRSLCSEWAPPPKGLTSSVHTDKWVIKRQQPDYQILFEGRIIEGLLLERCEGGVGGEGWEVRDGR